MENAFGIMSHTWRILLHRIHANPETANNIILACCVLHNFLRMESQNTDHSLEVSSDDDTSLPSIATTSASAASAAYDVRERIADWCITEGDVKFQYNMI